ncbi:TrbG/VirB9 family P-type conjugative transfer protein [Cupriavidus sp. CP313]
MSKSVLLALALGTAAATAPVHALQRPNPCGTDERVRCGYYDANEVYLIQTRPGNATMIQFEEGEAIQDNSVGLGDAKAWKVGAGGNWILLKPTVVDPDTNLLVVTNRRRYTFQLATAPKGTAATWSLSFDYPDTRARLAGDAQKRASLAAQARAAAGDVSTRRNQNYMMRGDAALAPTAMWDDGRFTYLRYATSRDLPVVFRLQPDGSEALTNTHMDGDTVVVHETAAQLVLRLGQAVLGIRNDGYTPDGQYNTAGTPVPGAVRVLKGVERE